MASQGEKEDSQMIITPLGAGNEVGRSCIIIEFKGKKIMLDCGIHPAFKGLDALPFFDMIDPKTIDLVLVSHFHLDHIASLPYFTEKTEFKGRIFMTHATKAVGLLLIKDYMRVSHLSAEDMLYDDNDLAKSFDKVETIDFHQDIDVDGVKFSCHHAGHVLGGAMFNLEIAGVKMLYTGDYSREEDRHLPVAEAPLISPHVMICESTYGVKSHVPLNDRESRFTKLVRDIVLRGGRCLIPIFASGRAQELLLILDEYWESHPELQNVPIYYASALANKCMSVYQTYINMMNQRIRKQFPMVNPFKFRHIVNLKNTEHFDDVGPCVMMASPGMLQSGMSRELFEAWCPDPNNGVIIPGYCVEGTLAKTILNNPKEITTMEGKKLPLKMHVDYISFSAHVDYTQNSSYIKEVNPATLVLVHGDVYEMEKLKKALEADYRENEKNLPIHTPGNGSKVVLEFKGERVAKIIGKLATEKPKTGQQISGVLVTKDFETGIVTPQDLTEFFDLNTSTITQRLIVPYRAGSMSLLQFHLQQMYQSVIPTSSPDGKSGLQVFDVVSIFPFEESSVVLEWIGNAMNDMIADSVVSIILSVEKSPSSIKALQSLQDGNLQLKPIKQESEPQKEINQKEKIKQEVLDDLEAAYQQDSFIKKEEIKEEDINYEEKEISSHQDKRLEFIQKAKEMLSKHFGFVEFSGDREFVVTVNRISAVIDIETKVVESGDTDLKKRVSAIFERIHAALKQI